ncbi:MAG: F0F1 ATP synthase subunit A [Candidatus Moraniibacteriota bacterium]|nr:MAG: F0F1 ATP synthase subunit A [Candidatus Moranbacteria bacterium]
MHISLSPEILGFIGTFPLTNTLLATLSLSGFVIAISLFVQKKISLVPKKIQNAFESLIDFLLDLVNDVMQDKNLSRRTFPLIASIFIFIWVINLFEVLPGMGTVGMFEIVHGEKEFIPFIRSASADMNMTLALTAVALFAIHYFGVSALGASSYLGKFFVSPFKKPYGIGTFVGFLELVSEVSKILSFSFRLFGNIFAGEVLLMVMLVLVPYFVPIPFLFMELFVGFIQALVFAMLTAVFIKMATVKAEH